MNPDKLFDYLEGRLPAPERAALEERLMSDKQLQRELAVARQIRAGMRGDSREVVLPARPDVTEQGRKMALRVGVAFIILMAVNVGFGLWLIVRHESRNPNRALLETQMRSPLALAVPLQKGFKTTAESMSSWMFHPIANKNFARRLSPLLEKYRGHPPSPRLRRTGRPRLQ